MGINERTKTSWLSRMDKIKLPKKSLHPVVTDKLTDQRSFLRVRNLKWPCDAKCRTLLLATVPGDVSEDDVRKVFNVKPSLIQNVEFSVRGAFVDFTTTEAAKEASTNPLNDLRGRKMTVLLPKPAVIQKMAITPGMWCCGICHSSNLSTRLRCRSCFVLRDEIWCGNRIVGSWDCHCGIHNEGNLAACFSCGGLRPVNSWIGGPFPAECRKAGDWFCYICKIVNFSHVSRCIACEIGTPEWKCQLCPTHPLNTSIKCSHCKAKRPANSWTCQSCFHTAAVAASVNNNKSVVVDDAAAAVGVGEEATSTIDDDAAAGVEEATSTIDETQSTVKKVPESFQCAKCCPIAKLKEASRSKIWKCGMCLQRNSLEISVCKKCKTDRVDLDIKLTEGCWRCASCSCVNVKRARVCRVCKDNCGEGTLLSVSEIPNQEWSCPQCRFLNRSHLTQCQRCSANRGSKSCGGRPLISRGIDAWYCTVCRTPNWAADKVCLICKKPVTRFAKRKRS